MGEWIGRVLWVVMWIWLDLRFLWRLWGSGWIKDRRMDLVDDYIFVSEFFSYLIVREIKKKFKNKFKNLKNFIPS